MAFVWVRCAHCHQSGDDEDEVEQVDEDEVEEVDEDEVEQVDEDEVVVCAAGHDHVAQLLHLVAERLAVAQHLQRGKDWQAAMDASIK